jgi:hypothetical protein
LFAEAGQILNCDRRTLAVQFLFRYIGAVNRLTKQEQLFLIIVLGLLLTGWAVKTYRTAHPPTATIGQQK